MKTQTKFTDRFSELCDTTPSEVFYLVKDYFEGSSVTEDMSVLDRAKSHYMSNFLALDYNKEYHKAE